MMRLPFSYDYTCCGVKSLKKCKNVLRFSENVFFPVFNIELRYDGFSKMSFS